MNLTTLLPIVFLGLLAASFMSKRRFGTLGLALAAGSVLSTIWSTDASLIVSALGVVPNGSLTTGVTLVGVTLLPSVVLMFKGKKYKTIISRLVGSVAYATLAIGLMLNPLMSMFPVTDGNLLQPLIVNKSLIIGLGLTLAVVDLLLVRPVVHSDKKSKR